MTQPCEPVDTSQGRGGLEWCRTHDRLWSVCRRRKRDTASDLRERLAAVLAVCDRHERGATRWADPLPVPEWIAEVRAAATELTPTRPEETS